MKGAVFTLALIAIASAEPPVPSNRYLPASFSASKTIATPSTNYGVPSLENGNGFTSPSLSSQYGVPSVAYGVPVTQQRVSPHHTPQAYVRSYDDQSAPANYNFQYEVQEAQYGSEFGHTEVRQGYQAQGKYYILLPDGRKQTVQYIADAEGYKPKISYEQTTRYDNAGYSNAGYNNGGYSQYKTNGGYRY